MTETKKPARKPATKPIYRDSKDGQFVDKEYAKKHPATTEREVRPAPTHSSKKK